MLRKRYVFSRGWRPQSELLSFKDWFCCLETQMCFCFILEGFTLNRSFRSQLNTQCKQLMVFFDQRWHFLIIWFRQSLRLFFQSGCRAHMQHSSQSLLWISLQCSQDFSQIHKLSPRQVSVEIQSTYMVMRSSPARLFNVMRFMIIRWMTSQSFGAGLQDLLAFGLIFSFRSSGTDVQMICCKQKCVVSWAHELPWSHRSHRYRI